MAKGGMKGNLNHVEQIICSHKRRYLLGGSGNHKKEGENRNLKSPLGGKTGRNFGKKKLFEDSPGGETWEGDVGELGELGKLGEMPRLTL